MGVPTQWPRERRTRPRRVLAWRAALPSGDEVPASPRLQTPEEAATWLHEEPAMGGEDLPVRLAAYEGIREVDLDGGEFAAVLNALLDLQRDAAAEAEIERAR